jgi:hypothetical protein
MSQVSCDVRLGIGARIGRRDDEIERDVKSNESLSKWFRQAIGWGDEGGPVRLEQTKIHSTKHERESQAGLGDAVAEGVWHTLN